MDRRELLGVLGAGAVGLAALTRATAAGADEDHHHHHDKAHEDCMKACGECAARATRRRATASNSS